MTEPQPRGRLVAAGDTRLHLTRTGDGEPVVWLHGSGPGASGVSNFRANLPAFADYDNLVFDHPRFGDSDRPHIEGPLIPYSGARVLAALDALGIDRFRVVGNSYGGGVAAWIAATAGERVTHAVLMAPGGLLPAGLVQRDLPYGLQLIARAMTEGVTEALTREFITAMVHDPDLVTDELVAERYEAGARNNPEIEGVPVMGDLSGILGGITAKTLLIWGRDDRFVLRDWAKLWLDAIEGSELHVFARCGHWAQLERRDDFNRLTRDFFAD